MGKPSTDAFHTYSVSQSTPEVQFYPAQRCVSLQQNPLDEQNDSQFHSDPSNRILKAKSDNPTEDETAQKFLAPWRRAWKSLSRVRAQVSGVRVCAGG